MADLLLKFVQYVAPVLTPRTNTGEINFDVIPHYIDHLISTGVQGKFSIFGFKNQTDALYWLLVQITSDWYSSKYEDVHTLHCILV